MMKTKRKRHHIVKMKCKYILIVRNTFGNWDLRRPQGKEIIISDQQTVKLSALFVFILFFSVEFL